MSVRIPVVGTPISEGEVELKSEDWNDSHSYHLDVSSEILKGEIKNTIRQLQDRAIDFSGDGDDVWAEAYVDSSGRKNSVDTSETTAIHTSNVYTASIGDDITSTASSTSVSSSRLDSFGPVENVFDGDDETFAEGTFNTTFLGTSNSYSTIEFSEPVFVSVVNIKAEISISGAEGTTDLKLEVKKDGSFESFTTFSSPENVDTTVTFDDTIEGIKLIGESVQESSDRGEHIHRHYLIQVFGGSKEGSIFHNLPSIFQKPTTKSVGTVLYDDLEEGNSIEYKLVDSSDNETGWLSEGELNSFNEITPEKVIVKLNPKEINPTTGFPSIKGFGFKAWND